ncbi:MULTISPECIES: SDR family oxidoreductase [unclassified Tatumella]|uniref:SDR family oxidoreductase n=1 Tax=unclassified Tatumella TaxID=2649542 RepID=UPI001BAEB82B|nr:MULTISPECIES: SDR family oxidoreductase [unclassified Tatumella]MBS0856180.1 SDR family oxidoreductase [Tatumella sp. JGM16]MBS0913159.1 SDR family oxidoreductase [Tatumella sp. JGM91]
MVQKTTIHAQSQTLPGSDEKLKPAATFIREDYQGSHKLAGKVALVTGGDSGIGRSVVQHFAREGADIALTYLPDSEEEAQDAKVAQQLAEQEGRKCVIYPVDLRSADHCRQLISRVVSEFGQLNILVNNAGTQYPNEDLTTLSDEQWLNTFDVNIHSVFFLTKAALPHMKANDAIINTTSVNAYIGPEILLDYTATKGAIVSFTRALSNQIVSKGIRVNAVAPGPVWTPLQPATLGHYNPQWLEDFGHETPMGRAGQPSELGPVYVFLASQDSSFISGQVLHPNGGTMVGG